ncbi:MAG: ABC transporter permease [Geminicoccaceae bacterium]|nr:ABC transporter permease [Geminicoccaceae bacterium]
MASIRDADRVSDFDPAWLILPLALMLVSMFLLPIAWFFVRTLQDSGEGFAEIVDTIWTVLTSPAIRGSIVITNWIALVVTLVALLLAYPIAYMMARSRGVAFTLLVMCVVLPYFTSVIVRTYSWMVILGRQGLINSLLLWTGIVDEPVAMMYNTFAVVVGMAYVLLPYLVLTLYATMKGIDPSLLRAARGLGAGGFYIFRRVYLPLTLHGVFSGCLIVFILAIGFFITPALMGGPSDVMIAMLIEREVELTLNWPLAAIMSLFLLVVTLVLYSIYYRFANIERMMG